MPLTGCFLCAQACEQTSFNALLNVDEIGGHLCTKTSDVADAVAAAGLGAIDKRKIELSPIKATGEHTATVRLRDEVSATINLQVVAAK